MCEKSAGAVAFLNTEGFSRNTATIRTKGIIRYKYTVKGKACHSALCNGGANAIAEAAHKILKLEKYSKESFNKEAKDGIYDQKYKDVEWAWKANYKAGKIQALKFKTIIYKTKDLKGKNLVGAGKVDFLESKYKEKQKIRTFNFTKFTNGIVTDDEEENSGKSIFKNKFDLKNISFNNNPENPNDMDPIQTNVTDSKYFFDNEDAISFKLGSNNDEN